MSEEVKVENTADYEFRLVAYVYREECGGDAQFVRLFKRDTIGEQKTFIKKFATLEELAVDLAADIKAILQSGKEGQNEEIGIIFESGQPEDITCTAKKPPTRYFDLHPEDKDRFWVAFNAAY